MLVNFYWKIKSEKGRKKTRNKKQKYFYFREYNLNFNNFPSTLS